MMTQAVSNMSPTLCPEHMLAQAPALTPAERARAYWLVAFAAVARGNRGVGVEWKQQAC